MTLAKIHLSTDYTMRKEMMGDLRSAELVSIHPTEHNVLFQTRIRACIIIHGRNGRVVFCFLPPVLSLFSPPAGNFPPSPQSFVN